MWSFLSMWRVGAALSLRCTGLSLQCLLLLKTTSSRVLGLQHLQPVGSVVAFPRLESTGSITVVPGLSCSVACEISLDQGSSPCLLHWQEHSLPLSHQGSPTILKDYIPFIAIIKSSSLKKFVSESSEMEYKLADKWQGFPPTPKSFWWFFAESRSAEVIRAF